jgi:hypothetical protein
MADSRGGQVPAWPGRVGGHLSGLLAVVAKGNHNVRKNIGKVGEEKNFA